MADQLYYEDIAEGAEIPSIQKDIAIRTLAMYCAGYEDFTEMHYDAEAAQRSGFPRTVVPGLFTSAFLAQMLTDWITPEGAVVSLKTSYRRPHLVGDKIVCKGAVTAKRVEGGVHLVECEVWAENADGERTTPGMAVIALPSRAE